MYHGSESVSFLGSKMWNIIADEIKQKAYLNNFKKSVKNGSHRIAHVDCAKFILMVSNSFINDHKCTEIYFVLDFWFYFTQQTLTCSH